MYSWVALCNQRPKSPRRLTFQFSRKRKLRQRLNFDSDCLEFLAKSLFLSFLRPSKDQIRKWREHIEKAPAKKVLGHFVAYYLWPGLSYNCKARGPLHLYKKRLLLSLLNCGLFFSDYLGHITLWIYSIPARFFCWRINM